MFQWKNRKYVNPRKRVFKNLDTNEILNLEIQDDPDNILEESETPLTADNLNQAQKEIKREIINKNFFDIQEWIDNPFEVSNGTYTINEQSITMISDSSAQSQFTDTVSKENEGRIV